MAEQSIEITNTKKSSIFKKAIDLLEKAAMTINWILLVILVLVVFGQVVSRYFFKSAMLWSQEAALFCFAWTTFLGSGVAIRHNRHFIFDLLPKENVVAKVVSRLGVFSVAWVYFYYGLLLTQRNWQVLTQPSGFRFGYFLASIPATGFLFLVFFFEELAGQIGKRRI